MCPEYKEMLPVNYLSVFDDAVRGFLRHLSSAYGIIGTKCWGTTTVLAGNPGGLRRKNCIRIEILPTIRIVLSCGLNYRRGELFIMYRRWHCIAAEKTGQDKCYYEQKLPHRKSFSVNAYTGFV